MATIEERAKESYPVTNRGVVGIISIIEQSAYIKGCIEQKQIDIDKACEWLHQRFDCHYMDFQEKTDEMVQEFRKAMEDKS